MRVLTFALTLVGWAPWIPHGVSAESQVLELHGSGTSNPSKCFWSIMSSLTEEAGVPVRLTYRSIGSGSGIAEFVDHYKETAGEAPNKNRIFFASGDIPINAAIYTNLTANATGPRLMHLPVMAGAVSFFHNVPGAQALNLTACVLVQIFTQKIAFWGDERITVLNPYLPAEVLALPITVARRKDGSSSTESSTKYMQSACTDPALQLPDSLVGLEPAWPPNTGLLICDGSSGMTSCIQGTNGTIGYIDYGHGASAGLQEVRLQVNGVFRHSQESVVAAAVTRANLPATPDLDHSNVTFLNGAGETTWPIVLMTYVYVRTNVTDYIANPQEQSLLIAFLRSLYNEVYIDRCTEDYGFTVMSNSSLPEIYSYAMSAIDDLERGADATSVPWIFENKDTQKVIGAGPYVFSGRRHVQLKEITTRLDKLEVTLASATTSDGETVLPGMTPDVLADLQAQLDALRIDVDDHTVHNANDPTAADDGHTHTSSLDFTESNQTQIKAAVVLSSISFVLWIFWIGAYIARFLRVDSSNSN